MAISAGRLLHQITIQRYTETEDPVTGYRTRAWTVLIDGVPAEFMAGPGREYLAGEALRSEVSGRFIVRWSPDTAAIRTYDRVLWDGRTWELKSDPIPDATARKELTLMVGGLTDAEPPSV